MVVRWPWGASVPEARSEGIAELYARHVADAGRLAYFLVGDTRLAEDMVQDAFIRVFARWQHLRNPDAFWAYLCRTLVNMSRKHFRRQRVERAFLLRHGGSQDVAGDAPPDAAGRDELWRALQTLPTRQRTALVLRFFADLSESQTADLMRCSVPAVNSLVARGLVSMRSLIPAEEE